MTDLGTTIATALGDLYALGGPVVLLLLAMSILAAGVALYKFWQFAAARVGRHRRLEEALVHWDEGDRDAALARLRQSRSHLAPIVLRALENPDRSDLQARLGAEAEANLDRLESGFPVLDTISQIAPLLGLFGTVLGMIDAFRALQNAGTAVDPSILAGGIWVALLTTAAGLAVAMPTWVVLTVLESRMGRERSFAELTMARTRTPGTARATKSNAGHA